MTTAPSPLPADSICLEKLARVGTDEILRRWAESVRAERVAPAAEEVTSTLLQESMSPVLAEILDAFESSEGHGGPMKTLRAARHGRVRARQLLNVKDVVREWQLLRRHIFLYLQEHGAPSGGAEPCGRLDDRRLLGLALDVAACATLTAFVEEKTKGLRRLSRTDGLTGLFNHRTFYERLDEELQRAERYESPLAVALLDLDDFKTVNDTCGHQFGDSLLVRCAELMRRELRRTDIICRYGGDEFGVIMPETTGDAARSLMSRLSDSFTKLGRMERAPATFGMSFGLSAHPEDEGALTRLVKLADERLLVNKQRA